MSANTPPLKDIFAEALRRTDPADRAAFLAAVCTDPGVRARVEALLRASDDPASFLGAAPELPSLAAPFSAGSRNPAGEGLDQTTPHHLPDAVGTLVARRYKLLETIGEGGMGTVWMAEQREPVKRLIALKLIKPGMDTRQVLARFEAERQALAMMDHPNIARVLDGGTTEAGRPYFVMELVKGLPLTEYCDARQLTVRHRLELFAQICSAIQHAHQKGIIHRDLKPTNVLITEHDGKPVPKVIDFGLAKALSAANVLTDRTLHTAYGTAVGTPLYMAPEQVGINALDVDTRTDIYSLGVIFYELLTGSTPLEKKRVKDAMWDELRRLIREVEPPRPSARLSSSMQTLPSIAAQRQIEPARLTKLVRGELDWIVMKALEKDRNRRYETANGFAADVLRYLAGEPVQAVPPSASYRLRKFARKHKAGIVTALGIAMLLVAGAALSGWQAVRAYLAERDANEKSALAIDAEKVAARERDESRSANAQLRLVQDDLRTTLYGARANLIQSAVESNNIARVHELLALQIPRAGERDLRGFEWQYWDRVTHGEVKSVAVPNVSVLASLSGDGTRLAVLESLPHAGNDKEHYAPLKICDAASGREIVTIVLPIEQPDGIYLISTLALSADGTRVAVVFMTLDQPDKSNDCRIVVWDAITGKELVVLRDLPGLTGRVSFSPDGKLVGAILTVVHRKSEKVTAIVQLWDEAGKPVRRIAVAAAANSGLAFSPDSKKIAAICTGQEMGKPTEIAHVWDVGTETQILEIREIPAAVLVGQGLVFSPDGARLATQGNQLAVWDAQTGKPIVVGVENVPGRGDGVESLQFSRDGKFIVRPRGQVVEIMDATTGDLRRTLMGHTGNITDLAFSRDGSRLVTVGTDAGVKYWDLNSQDKPIAVKLPGVVPSPSAYAYGTTLSPDSRLLALITRQAESEDEDLRVCTLSGQQLLAASLKPRQKSQAVGARCAFSTDGRRVAVVYNSKSHDGQKRVSLGEVRVWDLSSGKEVFRHAVDHHCIGVALSPDGTRVASAVSEVYTEPVQVKVWDISTGKEVLSLRGRPGLSSLVAFSPDGRQIAYTGGDFTAGTTATVWDSTNGAEVAVWQEPVGGLINRQFYEIAFGPQGRVAFTTGDVGRFPVVNVWRAGSGVMPITLRGHAAHISCIAFSPDGKRLVSASVDRSVKVWDVETGSQLLSLKGPAPGYAMAVAFSADGHRLIAAVPAVSAAVPAVSGGGFDIQTWDATPRVPIR